MVYTALFLTGLLSLDVQIFALAPATRHKISSASSASRLNILSNDFYRRRKRKITEIYQESGNGKDSGNSFKSDSVQKLLNFDQDSNIEDTVLEYSYFDGESETEGIDDATMEEIIQGQPSEWNIMKELLGINVFTFILAALIVFFLSMNYILGPGWLGSTIGIPGTGAFQEVSPSIPGTIDLNKPEYRL